MSNWTTITVRLHHIGLQKQTLLGFYIFEEILVLKARFEEEATYWNFKMHLTFVYDSISLC